MKASASPHYFSTPGNADILAESERNMFAVQYGASVIANINKKVSKRVDWINSTRFSMNGLSADQMNLSMRKRVIVKVWKFLQLRCDTRLTYDPRRSYDLGFSQEILFGIFYESCRSRQ